MSAFGVIVAGRMVQTDFTAVKENEFLIELLNSESINHIVVFLTGLHPLPADYGGSIYISWPSSAEGPQWHYLSFISNDKPSALFKIGQLNKSSGQHSLFKNFGQTFSTNNALLGIILEPINEIRQRIEPEKTQPAEQSSIAQFAEKMLRNFVNYVQSFAVSLPKPGSMTGQTEEYVPARAVTEWFSNFQRRLQLDPNFWKSLP